jgi:hypothetical protein
LYLKKIKQQINGEGNMAWRFTIITLYPNFCCDLTMKDAKFGTIWRAWREE